MELRGVGSVIDAGVDGFGKAYIGVAETGSTGGFGADNDDDGGIGGAGTHEARVRCCWW